jgi:GRIP domain
VCVQAECANSAAYIEELEAQLSAARAEVHEALHTPLDQGSAAAPQGVGVGAAPSGAAVGAHGAVLLPGAVDAVASSSGGDVPRQHVQALQQEVALLRADLVDEQNTHQLRDLADTARRREIQELQARSGRSQLDVEYLKNVLVGFFESGELPANPQVLTVLARLLCFTDADRSRLLRSTSKKGTGFPRLGIFG